MKFQQSIVAGVGGVLLTLISPTVGSAGCDWRYNVWCVPDMPSVGKPRWPDPRPPLMPKDSAWCGRDFNYNGVVSGSHTGWLRTNSTRVNKNNWPDYKRVEYAYIYVNRNGAWIQLDPPVKNTFNCHM